MNEQSTQFPPISDVQQNKKGRTKEQKDQTKTYHLFVEKT